MCVPLCVWTNSDACRVSRDERGRDVRRRAAPKAHHAIDEEVSSKIDTGLGDAESKGEVLKAFRQAEELRRENERLRSQMGEFQHAYNEISRLKNVIAEKIKIIEVLHKERGAMQRVHRQYEKDARAQEQLESEHSGR
jgi:hypothetical protein